MCYYVLMIIKLSDKIHSFYEGAKEIAHTQFEHNKQIFYGLKDTACLFFDLKNKKITLADKKYVLIWSGIAVGCLLSRSFRIGCVTQTILGTLSWAILLKRTKPTFGNLSWASSQKRVNPNYLSHYETQLGKEFFGFSTYRPVMEEIFFRGVVQNAFTYISGSSVIGILTSSLVFCFAHIPNNLGYGIQSAHLTNTCIHGIMYGLLNDKWGLVASSAAHILNNSIYTQLYKVAYSKL